MAKDNTWVWVAGIAALALLGGGTAIVVSKLRGVRNNNPGNIVISPTTWTGKVSPNTDGKFEQFSLPEYGIRALAKILKNYQNQHGLNTVDGIIRRWSATDQAAYVANVAAALRASPYETIDITDLGNLTAAVKAIIRQENSGYAYPDSVVNNGIAMA